MEEILMARKSMDITGLRVGKLTVLGRAGVHPKYPQELWLCERECGNKPIVLKGSLLSGRKKSCGCMGRGQPKSNLDIHGKCAKEYRAWASMKSRCGNSNIPAFSDYGGRGITVCDPWRNSFEAFFEDMGNCPEGQSLDRIDVEKGYSPENCRWASSDTQINNRRNTIYVEFQGETRPLTEWAGILGTSRSNIYQRLRINSPEETIQYYFDKKASGKNSGPVRLNKPLQLKSDGSSVFYVGKNIEGNLVVQTLNKEYLEVSLKDLQNTPCLAKRSSSVQKEASSKKATTLYPKQKTAQTT